MKNKFNGFTENGSKIIPKMASDWKFSTSYRNNYLKVSSVEVNQSFIIPMQDFFNKLSTLNISTVGRNIIGSFIFDKDRIICSEDEYFRWEDKQETIQNKEIKKTDLIVGEAYIDEKGTRLYYLGFRYIIRRKDNSYYQSVLDVSRDTTKIKKTYLFSKKGSRAAFDKQTSKIVSMDGKKGEVINQDTIDRYIFNYKSKGKIIFCEEYRISETELYITGNRFAIRGYDKFNPREV